MSPSSLPGDKGTPKSGSRGAVWASLRAHDAITHPHSPWRFHFHLCLVGAPLLAQLPQLELRPNAAAIQRQAKWAQSTAGEVSPGPVAAGREGSLAGTPGSRPSLGEAAQDAGSSPGSWIPTSLGAPFSSKST